MKPSAGGKKIHRVGGNLFEIVAYFMTLMVQTRIGALAAGGRAVEDLEIITNVRNGDVEAFAFLVEKYHKNLLAFIHRIVRKPDVVEDIGQEVFLSAYQSLGNFDAGRGVPFSAWLFAMARNRCFSELRRLRVRREERFDDEIVHHEAHDEHAHQRRALKAALHILEEPFRSAILDSLNGFSVEEIAAKEGLPRNTVKTRLFRAREKIRRLLNLQPKGIAP
jgi:RNA polymerase sigma-70 factor, ECF subfamily